MNVSLLEGISFYFPFSPCSPLAVMSGVNVVHCANLSDISAPMQSRILVMRALSVLVQAVP